MSLVIAENGIPQEDCPYPDPVSLEFACQLIEEAYKVKPTWHMSYHGGAQIGDWVLIDEGMWTRYPVTERIGRWTGCWSYLHHDEDGNRNFGSSSGYEVFWIETLVGGIERWSNCQIVKIMDGSGTT